MPDHTLQAGAHDEDNSEGQAVEQPSGAPQQDKLLAGKFKSKEALLDSVSELSKRIEGKELSPSEVIKLHQMKDDEIENMYHGLERRFHTDKKSNTSSEGQDDPQGEDVDAVLDKWAQSRGFVRKEEIERQKYEEEQLGSYLKQEPSARNRLDLIKKLAQMEDFKQKSYADIDSYIKSQGLGGPPSVKPSKITKMGQNGTDDDNRSVDDIPDDEFASMISGRGSTLRR